MTAYYNEIDPYAAQWLRNLIAAGHIAPGDVDERDIRDVRPDDLRSYTQCHFFAGIGVWSYALRLAGWPDDRPVWTGSCPCQPFSSAGLAHGFADERHLWPFLHFLIEERRPAVFFGEQVASKDGLGWLDLVHADMEGTGYAFGAFDLCAAGVGAPHIRQRLWLVGEDRLADADYERHDGQHALLREEATRRNAGDFLEAAGCRDFGRLGDDDDDARLEGLGRGHQAADHVRTQIDRPPDQHGGRSGASLQRPGPTNGYWRAADWLLCRDGKWRPVEPGTFPLAHEATARVGRLRAYGNAIVAQVAAEVIGAYLECRP